MDEAEKYQQRLEAIAEKRRLQEEQDKARREMEDEKLRLQQLKRKSLRDQWLMEGPPLSPTSPNSQSPRSPLWGSQAQEMEKRIDKLESENQRLAEEEEKLKEQMEDGQTEEAARAAEAGADIIQDVFLQNGGNNPAGFKTADDEEKTDVLKETAAVLTNGQSELEVTTNHSPSEDSDPPPSNGPAPASEDDISKRLEPEFNQGEAPNVSIEEEEEEEGTLVMRAERVIITDEGDDVPEDLTAQEDQQETTDLEETALKLETEAGEEGAAAAEEVGEVVVTEVDPETFTQPQTEEVTREDVSTNETDLKADEQNEASEDLTSVQPQCQVDALEGATVAPVPVYSEMSATVAPKLEAEGDAEEAAEAALEAEDPAPGPGQFQEVPLVDPQESSRTEAEAAERDPLLSQAKDPDIQAEIAAAANSLSSLETPVPSRDGQGEDTQAPKRKTCQCCSVM